MSADPSDEMRALLRQSLHDFNNVLGLILGFAGLLVRDLKSARAANPTLTNPPLEGLLDKAQEILDAAVQGEAIVKKMTAVVRSSQPADAAADRTPPPSAEAPTHVLLVKSSESSAGELSQAFAQAGWTTELHHSGGTALRAFRGRQNAYAAVVTDQKVAEISGPELIDALKALQPSIPCLLLLDPEQPLDRESAQLAGADAFRAPPLAPEELVGVVRELVSTRARRHG